ncbi:MAG: peptidoglycan recognition family protein, partial [Acidobacteriota bacterium]
MENNKITRKKFITRVCSFAGFAAWSNSRFLHSATLDIHSRYSPKNIKRAVRPHTRYIVLHTTEGRESGSFDKIWKRGEAHYFVNEKGVVYRIIQKTKIATHAGRSMWEGYGPVDNYSIGIEMVGYHNKDVTPAQYTALKELLRQLKSTYKIPDERVVTHSMVAYGRPNRFHPYQHRGRKRCGMIFARDDVRERLGLTAKPEIDKDVQAGRLRVADNELYNYLFRQDYPARIILAQATERQIIIDKDHTAWDIARALYDSPDTRYLFPDGRNFSGSEISDWGRIPSGTKVEITKAGEDLGFEGFYTVKKEEPARAIAGEGFAEKSTVYILPSGMIRTGYEMNSGASTRKLLESLPEGTRVLTGYVYGGHVKKNRSASWIAGRKWNYPSTFYYLPGGRIVSGEDIDDSNIPMNTLVLFQSQPA